MARDANSMAMARRVYDRVNDVCSSAIKAQAAAGNGVGAADDGESPFVPWDEVERQMIAVLREAALALQQVTEARTATGGTT